MSTWTFKFKINDIVKFNYDTYWTKGTWKITKLYPKGTEFNYNAYQVVRIGTGEAHSLSTYDVENTLNGKRVNVVSKIPWL